MPHYLVEVAYTPSGAAALVKSPQDRIEAVRPSVEKLGGKLITGYYVFGDYDLVAIVQFPDNTAAAAWSIACAAGGAVKSFKTTPLLTAEEAVEAMKKAGTSGYKPAAG